MAQTLTFNVLGRGDASDLEKLAAAVDRITDELRTLDRQRARPTVDVDTAKAERQIGAFATSMRRQLEAAVRSLPDIEINADSTDAEVEIAAIRADLAELRDARVGIDIDATLAQARVEEIGARLRRLAAESPEVQVRADAAAALAQLGLVEREVDQLDGRTAKVKVDVDKSLAESIVQVAALGRALGTLALPAAAIAAAPQIAAIGSAAVTASGALWLIPAAGTAAAVAVGTLALGFRDFGDAVSDDPKKAAEALAKLAPSAREAAVAVRELAPAWGRMQDAVQNALFDKVADDLRQLSGQYLPLVSTMLVGVAEGFNRAGQEVATFLQQESTVKRFGEAFKGIEQGLDNASQAAEPLARAITALVTEGASRMPQLGQAIADAAERFATFLETAQRTGDLGRWIDNGIQALQQLGSIAGNVGSALMSVFDAADAAGLDFLGTVDRITEGIANFLASAEGQSALVSLFNDIRAAVDAATPGVQALVQAVADVVQALGDAGVLEAAGRAFSAIAQEVAPLISSLGGLAPAIRAVLDVVTTLAPVLVPLAASFAAIKLASAGLEKLGGLAASFAAVGKAAGDADPKVGGLRGKLDGLKGLGPTIGLAILLTGIEVATGQIHSLAEEFRKLPEEQRSAMQQLTVGFDNWLQSFEPAKIGEKFAQTNWGDFWDPNGELSARIEGFFNSIKGVEIPPIKLDADGTLPRQKLTEIMNLVNSSSPTVNINGRDEGAAQALANIVQAINTGQGTVKINGVDVDARAALDRVVNIINKTMGYVQVNGETKLAGDALRDWIMEAQGTPGPKVPVEADTSKLPGQVGDGIGAAMLSVGDKAKIPVNADGTPLQATLPALAADVANTPGNMPVNADGAPFAGALPGVAAQAAAFPATITVQGNTVPAETALQLVLGAIQSGQGTVTINGNQVPATSVLAALMGSVNSSSGTVTINGQSVPAQTALSALIGAVNSGSGTVTINGQSVPAQAVLSALIGLVQGTPSTHTIQGNGGPAQSVINGLKQPTSSTHTVYVSVIQSGPASPGNLRINNPTAGGGVFGYAGGGFVGRPRNMRRGGVIPGYEPGVDRIPIIASKGESVLVPELTRALGARRILAANSEASGGRPGTAVGQLAQIMDGEIGATRNVSVRAVSSGGTARGLASTFRDMVRPAWSLGSGSSTAPALQQMADDLRQMIALLRERLGVNITVEDRSGDPVATARATQLAYRMAR